MPSANGNGTFGARLASAFLAYLREEPGAELVAQLIATGAAISASPAGEGPPPTYATERTAWCSR